ncbi:MAG: ComEC/Rec2 family competence protein [Actinomycetota bacterium]|nr:ComEC/Rec2 family competence protein [Actinomycetota bacterium]
MKAPFGALIALVLGIEGGARLGGAPAGAALVVGALALLGAWCIAGRARLAIAMAALALLGCGLMQRALDGLDHHEFEPGEVVEVEGTLVSDPRPQRFRTDALIRVAGADRIVVARANGTDASRLGVLAAGDRVELTGRVAPLPPDSRDRWRHAVTMLDDTEVGAFTGPRGPVAVANGIRRVVERGTRPLPPESRALLLGFLLGDTRGIPDDVADAYRDSGLSHLLAVSGANVAFVLALVGPALRRMRLGARTAVALAVIMLFATMTRFEPSVLRASVLAAVSVFAVFVGRPQASLRALMLAVIALLLIDPFLTRSVGFLLSCAASAGIVIFARPLAQRLRGPAFVREAFSVSFAAQLGVTPVLLAVFGSVPLAAPVANLLVAPAAEMLGVYGLVASLVGGLVPPLAAVLQPVDQVLLAWVTTVARATAALGGSVDLRGLLTLVALATLGRRAVRLVATRVSPAG